MYYVYAHIDPVSLKPFYVGMGSKTRTKSKNMRSEAWEAKVSDLKAQGLKFLVEILYTCEDRQEALKLEDQEIKLKSLGDSELVNLFLKPGAEIPPRKSYSRSTYENRKLSVLSVLSKSTLPLNGADALEASGIRKQTFYRALGDLLAEGKAFRSGSGTKANPYLYGAVI